MRDATSAKPIVSMYVKVKETTSGRDKLIVQSLYEKSIRLTKLNLVASFEGHFEACSFYV